jgi:hypothetical protein
MVSGFALKPAIEGNVRIVGSTASPYPLNLLSILAAYAPRRAPAANEWGRPEMIVSIQAGAARSHDELPRGKALKELGGVATLQFTVIFRHECDRKIGGKGCYRSHFGNG